MRQSPRDDDPRPTGERRVVSSHRPARRSEPRWATEGHRPEPLRESSRWTGSQHSVMPAPTAPSSIRSNVEAIGSFVCFGLDGQVHPIHAPPPRSLFDPREEGVDVPLVSPDQGLDRPVRPVPDPTLDSQELSLPVDKGAETHPLDSPMYTESTAGHHLSLPGPLIHSECGAFPCVGSARNHPPEGPQRQWRAS